ALAMGPEHLSCYEVIYEEDTPLYAQLKAGRFEVDEDLACDMYEALLAAARRGGFTQYEVANFGRRPVEPPGLPRFACRHNIAYWRGRPFHGLGPSASGFVDGVRTRNVPDTRKWCEALEAGRRAIEFRDELPPLARAAEIAGFGFRMNIGWGYEEFRETTGFDLRQEWAEELAWLERTGWGESTGDRFRLTQEGMRFADQVIEQFLRTEAEVAKPAGSGA
ncbi:MAG: coproporphyrinogen III oxidase, partial [Verrucomicrobia bacterium]